MLAILAECSFFFPLSVIAQAYGKKLGVLFIMNYCQFQNWAKGKVHVSTAVCTQCRVIASRVISQRRFVFSLTHALYLYLFMTHELAIGVLQALKRG